MKKNEKQTVIILGVLIVIIAIVMAVMLFSGRDTGSSGSNESLKNAVQQESNGQEEGSDASDGEDVTDAAKEDVNGDETSEEADAEEDEGTSEETNQESTEEVQNKTASQIMDADDGYVFPDADTTYLSKSSVKKLSDSELQYAVNEVYARHGLKFTKKINKERFEKKSWYKGTVSDQDSISLNKYEKKNVDTMAAELKKRGLR